jgi:hypothetical protein
LEGKTVTDPKADQHPDLIEQIPDPNTVRGWLAESIRRSDLLRSLLRVAIRKAAYHGPNAREHSQREVSQRAS